MYPNIEAERARMGWSRAKLAEYIGTTEAVIRNWHSGRTDLPASKLIKMAQLFGCSTDYLLGLDGTKEKTPPSRDEEETELHRLMRDLLIALSESQSTTK